MLFGTEERSTTAHVDCEDAVLLGQDLLFVSPSGPMSDFPRRSGFSGTESGDWLLELQKEGGGVVRVLFAEDEEEA